jgi:hypothetical protein
LEAFLLFLAVSTLESMVFFRVENLDEGRDLLSCAGIITRWTLLNMGRP